ncbi:hypothetical protein B0H15DRAFT_944296 [Mycena belliarum]|uniref:Uncharacterized protein n=1 Tax=Mycena belliarum TaxID=1033014 RepID=A0AAD6UFQ9_9AGAR|nr:hypothetical protein B0H15DRAFT_944296 [Mycena belliae]
MRLFASILAASALLSVCAGPAPGYVQRPRAPTAPVPLTNAVRMRAGFGPAMPRSILQARGGTLNPGGKSPLVPARTPVTSPIIPDTIHGTLRVTRAGGVQGFIDKRASGFAEYMMGSAASALVVTIPNPAKASTANIDILAPVENSGYEIWRYFGAFISPWAAGGSNFGPNSYWHAIIGPTIQVPAGPSAIYPDGTAYHHINSAYNPQETKMETAIWTVDPATLQVRATWINDAPNATPVPARILWSPEQNNFLIAATQNLATFNGQYGMNYFEVFITFVPTIVIESP